MYYIFKELMTLESIVYNVTALRIDLMGWTFPKAPGCVCCAFLPEHLYSNGVKGSKIPFSIAPGEKSPLFSIPWNDFEETLHYMNSNDDGTVRREIQRKKVKFYVSTPRSDKNLLFDIDRKIMDAFVESLNYKENISA